MLTPKFRKLCTKPWFNLNGVTHVVFEWRHADEFMTSSSIRSNVCPHCAAVSTDKDKYLIPAPCAWGGVGELSRAV